MTKKLFFAIFCCLTLAAVAEAENGPVKIWEGTIDLPTYQTFAPEKAPLFARDFAYQRAKRWVYPYPMNDYVSDIKKALPGERLHKGLRSSGLWRTYLLCY